MRRMQLNVLALAFVLFGMAISTTAVKGQVLIDLTNQVWKYDQSGVDPGAFWDPAYDDSAWLEGRSILANESSTGVAALDANVYPYTNTVLLVPGGRTVDYFRTHFTFSGAGNPNHWVLTASNLIDDGYVMYLNGVEVSRYNMNPTDDTLAAAANPAGEGVYVVTNLCIPAGVLQVGDNVLAVRVHQNAGTSSDVVWGPTLHSSLGSSPSVTSPTAPVNIPLGQGLSTNLNVTVQVAPCGTLQWYFDPSGAAPAALIDGATTASYTVSNMDASKAGSYFLRAVNVVGTTDSPAFNVTYAADTTAPTVRSASANPADLTMITVTFSEDVFDGFNPPFDPITFYLEDIADANNTIGTSAANYGASSNIAVLTLAGARNPAVKYNLVILTHGIQDRFNNFLADPTTVRVTEPVLIQEGLNGYAGTQDTEVRRNLPTSAAGANAVTLLVDTEDAAGGGALGPVHSLLRFDNLIGGQIPSGSIINKATLRVWTDDQGSSPIHVLRMLVNWNEASTWDSLVNGVDETNGVEAITLANLNSSDEAVPRLFDDIDVTSTVQAWANGAVNYGFAIHPVGTDGWRWVASENTSAAERPMLIVDYAVQVAPCNIQQQPAPSTTVAEKSPFTLTVGSGGSDLTYQWYFDPAGAPVAFSPIAGATGPTYTVNSAVPANSGSYYVVVQNNLPSTCTSATAVVNVTADTQPPRLTSALGNRDQQTISLTFNDTLDAATAGNPATYSLSGLSISGVAVNGSSVTLTSSAPRVVGNNYTLTITGLRDNSVARNLITPNPTVTNLAQQFVLLPFGSTWKFETNGTDLGTAWSQPGYNDAAWPSAAALLGFEDTPGTHTALFNQGLNTNNMTLWSRLRPDGTTNITYYLRKSVNMPYNTAGATLEVRHVTDDGALYYLNGTEVFRYNMPTGPVTYLTGASSAPTEGVIRTSGQLAGSAPCGNVMVAVELHNQNTASSDILFDGELLVTVPSFSACPTGGATLHIVNNGNGTVTLSWTGTGTLQQSTDLTNWTTATSQANPQTFTPVGLRFYRVQ